MRGFSTVTLLLALFSAGTASAQDSAAAAEALFDQGRAAMEKRDYETACQRFRESERIDPAAGTKLNLADCEERRGRIASAWELFRAAQRAVPESDERHAIAGSRAAALEPRLPLLTLRLAPGAPSDTRVHLGTVAIGAGSFGVPLPLDPGKHRLLVEAPRHTPRSIELVLAEGSRQTVDLAPGSVQPLPAGGAPAVEDRGSSTGSGSRTLGYVFGGVGIVGLVVGGVTGAMVLSKKSIAEEDCPDAEQVCNSTRGRDAADSGRALGPITTVSLLVGAAGLGAGAYFLLSAKDSNQTSLGIRASPGAAQLALFRSF
jgi:hypothetical protein